jgi:hypothetical protein
LEQIQSYILRVALRFHGVITGTTGMLAMIMTKRVLLGTTQIKKQVKTRVKQGELQWLLHRQPGGLT